MSDQANPLTGLNLVVSTDGEILGEDTPESREIVRRIQACVNACDGISTEELEKDIIRDMQQAISNVVPLLQERTQASPKLVVENRDSAERQPQIL